VDTLSTDHPIGLHSNGYSIAYHIQTGQGLSKNFLNKFKVSYILFNILKFLGPTYKGLVIS